MAAAADAAGVLPAGVGIGWRPEIADFIAGASVAFCEVIAESVHPAEPAEALLTLVARGVPVVPHGVSLSLGGAEPVDMDRVRHLRDCAISLSAPLVSEHVAFVRAGGIEAGHLLPIPRTREALDAVCANIARTQAELPVQFAVENIAALFDWPDNELTEGQFLAEIVARTGCGLVVDLANVYANARNRKQDPARDLLALPLEAIAYCHVAGGHETGGYYHDTHTDALPVPVLDLVSVIAELDVPLMLERDGNYPPAHELQAELDAIARARSLVRSA